MTERTQTDPVVQRLQSVPGVGAIVAVTFRAVIDRIDRFQEAGQVSALVGLVPREDSSAERQHRGHLTKTGSGELRCLMLQAAWACWRSTGSGALRAWATVGGARAAHRGGRPRASPDADLFAIWRDGSVLSRPWSHGKPRSAGGEATSRRGERGPFLDHSMIVTEMAPPRRCVPHAAR